MFMNASFSSESSDSNLDSEAWTCAHKPQMPRCQEWLTVICASLDSPHGGRISQSTELFVRKEGSSCEQGADDERVDVEDEEDGEAKSDGFEDCADRLDPELKDPKPHLLVKLFHGFESQRSRILIPPVGLANSRGVFWVIVYPRMKTH